MLPHMKAFDVGAATESIQSRAQPNPRQQGPGVVASHLGNMMLAQLSAAADKAPPYSFYPARRDAYLRKFWRTEPNIAGAVYSLSARIRALEYDFDGGRNLKTRYQTVAGEADFGRGYPSLAAKTVIDMLTQDNGAFWELLGAGSPDGPMIGPVQGVAYLDPACCYRTFDPEYPVVYHNPIDATFHRLHWTRVVDMANMPMPDEIARGIGYCSLSRAFSLVRTMKAIQRYKHEKITGTQPAIGYGNGFNTEELKAATAGARENADAQGLVYWHGIPFLLNPDADAKVTLGMVSIKGLPDGFDFETDTTLYIYSLALAFGVDAREFWPATASGATKADATVQHLKAQGKGVGDLIQTLEWAWNWRVLPDGIKFEYDFTDDEQDQAQATLQETISSTYTSLKASGVLNAKQTELHLIQQGILDPSLMEQGALTPDPVPPQPAALPGQEPPPKPADSLTSDDVASAAPGNETGVMSSKDYEDLHIKLIDKLTTVFEDVSSDELTRRQMASEMRTSLNRLGLQTLNEGLAKGGVEQESLSKDQLKAYRDWQAEMSARVTDLGNAVFKEDATITDPRAKAVMWANKTLKPLYYKGVTLAAPEKRQRWKLGNTETHCASCKRNAGKVKTMAEWEAEGLPQSDALDCGGFHCDCDLEDDA